MKERLSLANPCLSMALVVMLLIVSIYGICIYDFDVSADNSSELFILMYHNIISDKAKPNKYEIRVSDLERDIRRIKDMGMSIITPSDIYAFKAGRRTLPKKCVMLTFDDGYYSYITYLLPLLEKYNVRAEVNVVGEYTSLNKDRKDIPLRYTYLDYDDIKALSKSGRVEIGLHSYGLHHTKGNGASQHKGEGDADYERRLLRDTKMLTDKLNEVGITSDIYAYPYGAYSRCSDKVLSKAGIKMTLSCSEGVNHLSKDSSLYLLRRYNRSGLSGRLEDTFDYFKR